MHSNREKGLRKRKNSDIDVVQTSMFAKTNKNFLTPTMISEVSIKFIFRPQDETKITEQKRQEGKLRVLPCPKRLKYFQQKSSFHCLISHCIRFRKLPGRHFPADITDKGEGNKTEENTTHFCTNTFQLSK